MRAREGGRDALERLAERSHEHDGPLPREHDGVVAAPLDLARRTLLALAHARIEVRLAERPRKVARRDPQGRRGRGGGRALDEGEETARGGGRDGQERAARDVLCARTADSKSAPAAREPQDVVDNRTKLRRTWSTHSISSRRYTVSPAPTRTSTCRPALASAGTTAQQSTCAPSRPGAARKTALPPPAPAPLEPEPSASAPAGARRLPLPPAPPASPPAPDTVSPSAAERAPSPRRSQNEPSLKRTTTPPG